MSKTDIILYNDFNSTKMHIVRSNKEQPSLKIAM